MRRLYVSVVVVALLYMFLARTDADPYTLALTVMTVTAVAAGIYLGLISVLAVLAVLFRAQKLRRLLLAVTPDRIGRYAAGIALMGGMSPAYAQSAAGDTLPAQGVTDTAATDVTTFIERLGLGPVGSVLEPQSTTDMSYSVVAGDSFWQIAKRQVEAHDATAPVRAVAVYWLELIETNLDQLVVAGDPNLLLPGQVLQLPAFHLDGPS
jgi:hypothetical protein